jgi:hypothetical protein
MKIVNIFFSLIIFLIVSLFSIYFTIYFLYYYQEIKFQNLDIKIGDDSFTISKNKDG